MVPPVWSMEIFGSFLVPFFFIESAVIRSLSSCCGSKAIFFTLFLSIPMLYPLCSFITKMPPSDSGGWSSMPFIVSSAVTISTKSPGFGCEFFLSAICLSQKSGLFDIFLRFVLEYLLLLQEHLFALCHHLALPVRGGSHGLVDALNPLLNILHFPHAA